MPSLVNVAITIMDHLAVQCKKKLESFRIKELKDVLSRIGAGKRGKKQVLVDKIMQIMIFSGGGGPLPPMGPKLEGLAIRNSRSREDVAKIIDDVYRMRHFSAPDLATSGIDTGIRDVLFSSIQQSIPHGIHSAADSKIRCPCGSLMEFGRMIQCEAPSCLARQHVDCVIIPEKEDMKPETPSKFYCEVCRIQNGDPFCVSVTHPLMPIKTIPSIVYSPEGGASLMQNLESSFTLTHSDRELLRNPEYDLQIWSVLLGDEVKFRMHWPLKAELRVNGDFVRVTTNRPGQQKLGTNGRDDGPVITDCTREGLNRISFTSHDGRSFCLGVRIIRRLTVGQVLSLIPGEAEGESLDVALARVRRCIGGGGAVNDDSDSDLEVVSELVTVNLRCPMSGSRIRVAGRFKACTHMGCFDLHTFVELNQRARKWQCPSCLKNYSLRDLVIDPFFMQVVRALESYDEDVSEVEMKPDGCWRPKLDGDARCNELWRHPVGFTTPANNVNWVSNPMKAEEDVLVVKVPLKLGFNELPKVNETSALADLTIDDMFIGHGERSHSSSATASKEVSSVNQEPLKFHNQFGREEVEVNSCPFIMPVNTHSNQFLRGLSDQGETAEIILLSDEEDDLTAFDEGAEGAVPFYANPIEVQENYGGCSQYFQSGLPQGYSEGVSLTEVGSIQPSTTVALDFLGMGHGSSTFPAQEEMWQTEKEVNPFDLLSSAPEGSEGQGSHHNNYSMTVQTYTPSMPIKQSSRQTFGPEMDRASPSKEIANTGGEGYQILGNESSKEMAVSDPSFREFLPHQPARSTANVIGHECSEALTHEMQNGWFSLSLGGTDSFTAAAPLYELPNQRTQIDPLVESASLLLDLSQYNMQVDGTSFGSKRTKGSFASKHFKPPCSLVIFSNEISSSFQI